MVKEGIFLRLILIGMIIAEAANAQVWTEYLGGVSIKTIIWDSKRQLLWFATSSDGVISFDGTTFTDYNTRTTKGQLITDTLTYATIDRKYELWFGTTRHGLIRFNPDSSKWRTYILKDGLLPNPDYERLPAYINTLAVDDSGAIWIGTNGSGANRFDRRSRWDTLTVADGLRSNDVLSIASDSEGYIWFGTFSADLQVEGLSRLNCAGDCFRPTSSGPRSRLNSSATWQYFLPGKIINAIFIDRRGDKINRWFAGEDSVYNLPPNSGDTAPRSIPNQPEVLTDFPSFTSIIVDENGYQWFGFSFGAVRLDLSEPNPAQRWKVFDDPATISTRAIKTITLDEDGNLWFGDQFQQGVVKLNSNWLTFTGDDGLTANTVGALAEDNFGTIWAGTPFGLSKLNSTRWINFFEFTDNFATIAVDKDNGLWLGTDNAGAIYVPPEALPDDNTNKFYRVDNSGIASNTINDIAIFQRDVWFATENGLSRFEPDSMKWETFDTSKTKGDLIDNRIQTIAIEMSGIIWCGTVAGVSRFEPKTKTSTNFILTKNGQLSDWVTDILLINDQADTVWFATNGGGVSPYFNGRWQKPITLADGLADNNVNALVQSLKPAGEWFGTRNGATFRDPNGTLTSLRTQHGLGGNVIVALLRDKQHRIWFGTQLRGVTRYTRKENRPHLQLLNTFDVTTSSEIVYKFEGSDIGTPTHLLRYAYRLSSDKDYSPWTLATFAQLAIPRDGMYTFYVKSIDTDGNESNEATDTFYKIAPDKGSYTHFAYKIGKRGVDSVEITLFWPPNQFQHDPQISVESVPSDSVDALFAFDLTSKDSSLIFFEKPITLAFSFQPSNSIWGKPIGIYRERPERVKLGGTPKINGEISTAIQELGRYSVRETTDQDSAFSKPEFTINVQPRIFSPAGGGHGPQTTLSFKLDKNANVRITVYNLAGRLVDTVWDELMYAGVNAVAWDGRDKDHHICPTGLYIMVIESNGFQSPPKPVKVMVLNE